MISQLLNSFKGEDWTCCLLHDGDPKTSTTHIFFMKEFGLSPQNLVSGISYSYDFF